VFSDSRVQELSEKFVCVKVDPRESREASQFKGTRYVPEVVFLTSNLKVITRLKDRTAAGTADLMRRVLRKYGR
jgi:hypothetical protein